MRELTIGKNDAGQRLDRFLSKALPLLPPALAQKYIRIKRVKVNGGRAQRDQRLQEGDILQLYINDEFFDKPREDNLFLTLFKPSLDIVYEDENLLLLNKRRSVTPIGQSIAGAVLHNLGQVLVAMLLTNTPRLLLYFTPLGLLGVLTGALSGLAAKLCAAKISPFFKKK